jgi:hypothetical protein
MKRRRKRPHSFTIWRIVPETHGNAIFSTPAKGLKSAFCDGYHTM